MGVTLSAIIFYEIVMHVHLMVQTNVPLSTYTTTKLIFGMLELYIPFVSDMMTFKHFSYNLLVICQKNPVHFMNNIHDGNREA